MSTKKIGTKELRLIWQELYKTKQGTPEEHAAYQAYIKSSQGVKSGVPAKRRLKK
jgi:hypothetical protein